MISIDARDMLWIIKVAFGVEKKESVYNKIS